MRSALLLSALALACGSSAPKPAPAPATPADPPPPAPEAAPAKPAAPAAELPPIPEAPPPAKPGAPRPHVSKALAFLPADTQLVIGIDVPRVASTALGDKLREAFVGAKMPPACEALGAAQFGNVVFGANGSGKLVVVLDGKLAERAAVACIEAAVQGKGAKTQSKTIGGRKVYYVSGGATDNGWITWTKAGVVMASSEAALTEALDPKAAKLGGDLGTLALQVDHGRMLWGAGVVPAPSLAALGVPASSVNGPVTVRAGLEIAGDTDVDVVLGCASAAAATALGDAVRTLIAPMRSSPGSAQLLAGLRLGVHGSDVHATARLDADTTRKLINAVNVK